MPRNIDTALLRAFAAVAETGGMTRAAGLLNLTQAAVSQQVKRLEEQFGQRLFERGRRGLTLTPAGERLQARAGRLLAMNDEVWATMTAPDFAGEVRLGIPIDIVRPYMPPILRRFYQAWPRVRVSLICETSTRLLELLDEGRVDLTMTTEPEPGPHGEVLFVAPLVWVGTPGGNAAERDPLPLSTGGPTCAFRPAIVKALAKAGRDWQGVCEISNLEPILATIEADLAVAALIAPTVPGHLQVLGTESGLPKLPAFSVNLYLPHTGATPLAAELARHIRDQMAQRLQRAA
ncbi:MAG: LysR family transcriptional regulator [Bauldia sp.]